MSRHRMDGQAQATKSRSLLGMPGVQRSVLMKDTQHWSHFSASFNETQLPKPAKIQI